MGQHKQRTPEIQDMGVRFDGRVLKFDIFVNSDEDLTEVLMRLQKAARGQKRNAVMAAASLYTGDAGREIWAAIQKTSAEVAANPKAKAVDEDGKPIE